MHDNCGNPVVFMRPCVLDDLVSELENGGAEFVLSVLREMQMDAVKGIEILKSL